MSQINGRICNNLYLVELNKILKNKMYKIEAQLRTKNKSYNKMQNLVKNCKILDYFICICVGLFYNSSKFLYKFYYILFLQF